MNVSKAPSVVHLSTNSIPSTASSTTIGNDNNPGSGSPASGDQQIMVFCTEKSAAVYSLPSQRQMYTQTINESSYVVSANIGAVYVLNLLANSVSQHIPGHGGRMGGVTPPFRKSIPRMTLPPLSLGPQLYTFDPPPLKIFKFWLRLQRAIFNCGGTENR